MRPGVRRLCAILAATIPGSPLASFSRPRVLALLCTFQPAAINLRHLVSTKCVATGPVAVGA